MLALKLEFASLTALRAQQRTKKGEQIVPKGYPKSNMAKELLRSRQRRLGWSPMESRVSPTRLLLMRGSTEAAER